MLRGRLLATSSPGEVVAPPSPCFHAHKRLRDLLQDQVPDRYDAYLALITFCEEPRTLTEISEFLIGNPGLEIDDRGIIHMQPNAYIGKLDTAGALVWTGEGWQSTPQALEVIETL